MNYYIIPAALITTFFVTLLISMFSRRPFGGLWLFFIIIFLATWAGQLWITPFGPATWGISWITLIVVALFFGVLLVAMGPPVRIKAGDPVEKEAAIVLGAFFWIVIILLIASIGIGYYKMPYL